MELDVHKKKFESIVEKYNLSSNEKASEIAKLLTSGKKISYVEFATKFEMSEEDADIFLSFISKGIAYKEEVIDPNNK